MPAASGMPGAAGPCPDTAKASAIEAFDFEKEFKLNAEVAAKLKAGAAAAAEMKTLDDRIESDLKAACGNLAHDLGAAGDYKDAQAACKAANQAIADTKNKLGPKATIVVNAAGPHCGVELDAYADCAGQCDANVKGGKAEVRCEPGKLQGECSGKCQGECDVSAGAQCSGECRGTCDAQMKGECGGTCSGKCDGKAMPASANGRCNGTCDGKCDAAVKAACKGQCSGSCKVKTEAECKGTCTGSCSVAMQAPQCVGKVDPPQVSAECKAKCDAGLQAKAKCTAARVMIRIGGAADANAEAMFRQAIEKDLGPVLAVAVGTGKAAEHVANDMKVVIEGVQASIQSAGDPTTVGRLTACLGAPVQGALASVSHVQANVSVSVSVQASASASASGSASAGAKSG
jgi:hypothetical protein